MGEILLLAFLFLIAGVIAFSTGTSWGTFAILFPLALPAAVATDAPLAVTIGAVLSGGLFGDHSSPISETTILAATGADCSAYDHFRTQLPYALIAATIAPIVELPALFQELDALETECPSSEIERLKRSIRKS